MKDRLKLSALTLSESGGPADGLAGRGKAVLSTSSLLDVRLKHKNTWSLALAKFSFADHLL